MRPRYGGTCRVCGSQLPAKADAIYERATRTVRCISHEVSAPPAPEAGEHPDLAVPEVVDPGTAGASARREFERRKIAREERIRAKHPKLGGLILAISEDPQSTTAWNTGALGEEKLGGGLNSLPGDTIRLLHDRRMPRTKANIDHLAVTPTGVYVIDAKKYRGRPTSMSTVGSSGLAWSGFSSAHATAPSSWTASSNRSTSHAGSSTPTYLSTVSCASSKRTGPLLGGDFTARGVHALWPKKLYPKFQAEGPLTAGAISEIHRTLAQALPTS